MAKIIFMGTPNYAKTILRKHLDHDEVVAVVTQPDKPVGRKKIITAPPVKELALEAGIECLQPEKIGSDFANALHKYGAEFLIVAAYGQILPQSVLDVAVPINLHASLLPKYRGASPVQEALLHGDSYTGVTAMLMEQGLDSGPILGYRAFKLANQTLGELMDKLADEAAHLSVETVKNFTKINPLAQEGALKSYCKKIKSSDASVSFDNAKKLDAKFRAYYGWPGMHLQSGLKIKQLRIHSCSGNFEAGKILDVIGDEVIVGCEVGSVAIAQLQPANKKAMDAKSYLNGKRLNVGDTLL